MREMPKMPIEPTMEQPGALLTLLSKFIEEVKEREGKEPPAMDVVIALAHILDLREHRSAMSAYNTLKKMRGE